MKHRPKTDFFVKKLGNKSSFLKRSVIVCETSFFLGSPPPHNYAHKPRRTPIKERILKIQSA